MELFLRSRFGDGTVSAVFRSRLAPRFNRDWWASVAHHGPCMGVPFALNDSGASFRLLRHCRPLFCVCHSAHRRHSISWAVRSSSSRAGLLPERSGIGQDGPRSMGRRRLNESCEWAEPMVCVCCCGSAQSQPLAAISSTARALRSPSRAADTSAWVKGPQALSTGSSPMPSSGYSWLAAA